MKITNEVLKKAGACRRIDKPFEFNMALKYPARYLRKYDGTEEEAIWLATRCGAVSLKRLGRELCKMDYADWCVRDRYNANLAAGEQGTIYTELINMDWPEALKLMRKYARA